ncbi:MAG: tetraacyldisaccharide 4'-kinase [Alphaproteobacteria bacterium]
MWKTPKFWLEKNSLLAWILFPLGLLYSVASWLRCVLVKPYKAPCPIICVGNATVGGAGKTPTVLAIAHLLQKNHQKVACLSRGYGGRLKGPVQVNSAHHKAPDTGDEPLLLAQVAPTWVAKDRRKGALSIGSVDAILMDDGYQNPGLYKDLNLLVIDGPRGFGNGFVFPAGPLRGPLNHTLKQADAVVVIGRPSAEVTKVLKNVKQPTFQATLEPKESLKKFQNKKFIAFCGLATPDKFFQTLKDHKVKTLKEISFPDHYLFSDPDLETLLTLSQEQKAPLLTTEKDWVRLPDFYRKLVIPFPIVLKWEQEEKFESFLMKKLHEVS